MKKKQKKVVFDFLNSEKPIIKKYLSSVHRAAANGKKKKKKKKKKPKVLKQSDSASDTSGTKVKK